MYSCCQYNVRIALKCGPVVLDMVSKMVKWLFFMLVAGTYRDSRDY